MRPPDGLMITVSSSPRASRTMISWEAKGAWISATSTGPSATPATSAALAVDGDEVRSRAPSEWVSIRWSNPVIHTGLSAPLRGLVPGGQHDGGGAVGDGRQGVAPQRRDHVLVLQQRLAWTSLATWALGLDRASFRLRAAMAANSASVPLPASIRARACRAARLTGSGHSGAR